MKTLNEKKLYEVFKTLHDEYRKSRVKHPAFAKSYSQAVAVITEELGELAKEINDEIERNRCGLSLCQWRRLAMIEAAHVAVTAFRTMLMLAGDSDK